MHMTTKGSSPLVTWVLRSQAGAPPGWVAGSLASGRFLLWVLNVFLLQMIEYLIQGRLQCLCCLSAVKLPFQTLCLEFLLSLQHRQSQATPKVSIQFGLFLVTYLSNQILGILGINLYIYIVLNLVYDVVKLLLHFLLYLFDFIRRHREVSHLILKLLQHGVLFIFLLLVKFLRYSVVSCCLFSTFGLILCFLKIKTKQKRIGKPMHCQEKKGSHLLSLTTANTDLPVTLLKVLDKFHQVCWVSDDFKVEFFY